MAKVIIHLLDPEISALHRLAQQEFRPVRSQAALIIRNELKRLGMLRDQPASGAMERNTSPEANAGDAT